MSVINQDLSLNSRFFEIEGNQYEVRKSVSNGRFIKDTVDTIKNHTNGNVKTMNRFKLKEMLTKFNAKLVAQEI